MRHYGQVMIEFISAFLALIILLVGITKVFVWMGNTIISRNTAFEASRTAAGHEDTIDANIDFYTTEDLEIFEGWGE